jgi:cytoskeleton protein RodZ
METLGVWLRLAREARGSTLEEAGAATHIRPRFLEALEAGDFAAFPGGDVQVRGFLRIYARYLGLSADEALARYDAEVHGIEVILPRARPEARPSLPARAPTRPLVLHPPTAAPPPPPPRVMGLEKLIIGGIVLMALLVIVTGVGYFLSRETGEGAAAVASATATPSVKAGLVPTESATTASPIVEPTFPISPQGEAELTLEATEHVWARVTADGQKVFEGMLATGQVETWLGRELIVVDTGNGAGLLVTVNGQPQGRLCGRAQVCTRAWGPAGEVAAP